MKMLYQKRLAMYKTVHGVMVANETKWVGIPAFVSTVNRLGEKIIEIDGAALVQSVDSTGVTEDREALKVQIADLTVKFGGVLKAFASISGNHKLLSKINGGDLVLLRLTKTNFINRVKHVIAAALKYEQELISYGIQPGEIQLLQVKFDEYSAMIEDPRMAIAERAVATNRLDLLNSATSALLKKELDQLMKIFRKDDVDFYKLYKSSRIIIDPGFRKGEVEAEGE